MKQDHGSLTAAIRTLAFVALLLPVLLVFGPASPAAAHAQLTGSEPAAGTALDAPPHHISLFFAKKPVTLAGDPVEVYDPTGQRVDEGALEVSDDGRTVSIGLRDPAILPAGTYHVVYRVLSLDSHLVTGHFEFSAGTPQPGPTELAGAQPILSTVDRPLSAVEPANWWPKALAVGAIAAAVATVRRLRRPAS